MVATQTHYLYQYIRKTHLGILVSTKTYKSTRKAHLSLWRAGHSTEQSIENPFILTQTMVVRIPWWSFRRNKFLFIRPEFDHCCQFFLHSRLIELTLADEDALLTLLLTLLITWWQLTAWQQLDNSTFTDWPQLRLFGNIL